MIYLNFIQQNPKLKLKKESTAHRSQGNFQKESTVVTSYEERYKTNLQELTNRESCMRLVNPQNRDQLLKLNTAMLKVWAQDITNEVPGVSHISPPMSRPGWKWLSVADFNKQETELLRKRLASLSGTSDTPPITPTPAIVEARNFRKDTMLIFNAEAPNEFGDVEELVKAVQVFEDENNAEFFLTLSEAIRWRWVCSKIALTASEEVSELVLFVLFLRYV
ncbi:hypothetical protein CROQUDRAFT_662746 [Cronartium quercuum f. sp. fusiforme G11]|uniref:Uncharacterized protein n=1 Tax=Cronartium quercuum f. sp. fusiforme G11 TaxID=708437 RepID=A0A9P6N954_9BASI|nr:hypothetical protein CROQUDRAFT_662746 [Cronartium quercuum f. sp. fusiforme G11]